MPGLLRAIETLRAVVRHSRQDLGATAVEYAIMAGFIALVIIGAVAAVGNSLNPFFTAVAAAI